MKREKPTPENIALAAKHLRAGRLVAFPTETVYGLGADATSDRAVARIFKAKNRPSFNPLIVHYAEPADVVADVAMTDAACLLADAFWPGPLTLVMPRLAGSRLSELVSAGRDSVAVRVPAHPVARDLLAATGRPVAAPSANRSGSVSPTNAAHVAESLGDAVAMILDGGACALGLESTILDVTDETPALLRPGGLPLEDIEAVVGPVTVAKSDPRPRDVKAPGMLESHYAPAAPVRLGYGSPKKGEVLLAFGSRPPRRGFADTLNLSPKGDLGEAAANLFAMLRRLDRPGVTAIATMPVPDEGLGRAINDRLRRAAAPRD